MITVLCIVFILAKVFQVDPVAGWSWWAVFSPLLAYMGFLIMFMFTGVGAALLKRG